ncbi:NAD(P)-binding domain-containing protein [Jidongwangia harbinensis]|uniref:NAD(P)-binding domain-containing protein n=1 Tax=Jidongwangia harbinensis TaxID=2878561 RepID=UPI001CDA4F8C|nr:NAD(P)-binding domain-containing protein [Jidongwangia harbinensis]MCA2215441.1 hypothetical protein [Jidongwangia harbinensis]
MTDAENPAPRVTVIGMGAIGSAVADRLRAGGRDVVTWNRTPRRGAAPARPLAEAVAASALTFITVTDYPAVQKILTQAGTDLSGRTIVVMCTGTPGDARAAAERIAGLGADHLDAGIQASPATIGTDAATILYSGSRRAYQTHVPTLRLLGGPRFAGTAPHAAAVWDLALFGLWYDAQLGLLRALDTVRSAGIDMTDFAGTAGTPLGHVVAGTPDTVAELLRGTYPPGPADLAGHLTVVRHLIELRTGQWLGDGGLTAVAARLAALIDGGRGADGLTATIGQARPGDLGTEPEAVETTQARP